MVAVAAARNPDVGRAGAGAVYAKPLIVSRDCSDESMKSTNPPKEVEKA
jgi:hypothetical protein